MSTVNLYKYREINENTYDILKNSRLYFSKPEKFNDIFEGKYNINNPNILESFRSKIPLGEKGDIHKAMLNLFQKQIKKNKHKIKICCFSIDNDNQLMWSHYSNSYKGICLQFTLNKSDNIQGAFKFRYLGESLNPNELGKIIDGKIKRLEPENVNNSIYTTYAWPVVYRKSMPNFAVKNHKKNDSYIPYFRIKNKKWEYENEYRVSFENNILKSSLVKFDKSMLTGIIFGNRTSVSDKQKIHSIVKNNYIDKGINVNFYQLSPQDDYSLKIERCK